MPSASESEGRPVLGTTISSLLQHVRRLATTAESDEQLLADFLTRRDEAAFAALIGRHGPMVLNVCRRVLRDAHAAEDVFQATFLVLADRAGSIRRRASLASFLHGVAYRLAVRARKRPVQGLPGALCANVTGPEELCSWKEMLGILDHELGRLSDRYRAPLVLCYLEGLTQDEAARQLGWSLNTMRRRLAQGRRLLQVRLRNRGVTLSAMLTGLLASSAGAVPGPLQAATVAGALAGASGAGSAARNGITLLLSTSGKKLGAGVAVLGLAAAVCFGYGSGAPAEHPPVARAPHSGPPAVDANPGDPVADLLPDRGAVRIGTARYRHGSRIASVAVSDDGALAVTASGYGSFNPVLAGRFSPARVFDLTDGRCLYSLPSAPGEYTEAVGLSPDGKTLATKGDKFIHFWDAATGKELRKLKYLADSGGERGRSITDWMTFTPDGKRLAVTLMGHALQLIDVETATVARTFDLGAAASACVFSADGKFMAAGGYEQEKGVYFFRIWEVGTGKELRRFPAGTFATANGVKRALAFSPNGATIVGGGWGATRLRLWETATGKEPTAFPKIGEEIVSVAFAPDGKTVAAAAENIYLYDPVTGKERLRIDRRARGLAFSRDGAVLTGAVSGAIYRWDATSGRQLTPASAQDSPVEQILAGTDGRQVFTTDQDGHLYVWNAAGGNVPRRIASGVTRGVVASADGRFLAWAIGTAQNNCRIQLYDTRTERLVDRFPALQYDATVAAFLPDGKALLTLGERTPAVRLWDIESAKERRSFPVGLTSGAKLPDVARSGSGTPFYTARRGALSPDGKTLAIGPDWEENLSVNRDEPVRLWDVATGKAGPELKIPTSASSAPSEAGTGNDGYEPMVRINRKMKSAAGRGFSPDGRLLVDWAENPFGRSRMDHVCVWDVATGRVVANLTAGPRPGAANAAFAPDGRTLATASADGTIRLWEVATWKVRSEFRGHRDQVTALAFGPDGRLFTGGLDTVVLGWDVRPPRQLAKGTLAEAWDALIVSDGKAGFQAQGRFLAEPDKAVEWLAARMAPASPPDPARVKALIADLDDEDFATREGATAELKEHGSVAAAGLREVAAKSSSAEARRRAAGILGEIANGVIPPRELRALRAMEVLEWIATKEARAQLLELMKGAPDARLTREAVAACKRLEGRK